MHSWQKGVRGRNDDDDDNDEDHDAEGDYNNDDNNKNENDDLCFLGCIHGRVGGLILMMITTI